MIRLFTDTDADITPEVAAKYGYSLISMPYSVNGTTVYPYEDFKVFDSHTFYDMLRSGVIPTTGAISTEKYIEIFEPVFAGGDDIFYVHFSAAMTATFENMKKAYAVLQTKYPDRKLYTVDTKGITTISYMIVCEIGKLFALGKSAEEVLDWAKTEVDHFAMYFFADDLKFFKKSGRVSGLAATMGTMLGIRPIIIMDSEGKMTSIGKERGRIAAMERLVASVCELGDSIEDYPILIGHTDSPDIAKELADMVTARFPDKKLNIELVVVNPTAGSHCGPNGVGICFHAIHR